MEKSVVNIKIIKENVYEVDINRLADDLEDYLADVLEYQFCDGGIVTDILEDESRRITLLERVGQIWHDKLLQCIVDKKITSDEEVLGINNEIF